MDLTTISPLPDGASSETVGGSPPNLPDIRARKQSKTEAVAEVNDFYEKKRQERRPHEIQWFVNAAFVRGQQTGQWNQITSRLEAKRAPSHRVRRTINLILPKVKARLAKFVKSRPLPTVVPASTNREAVMNAKVTEKVLGYMWRKLGLETKYEDAIFWAMITGKSYWWFHWNPNALGQVKQPDGPMGPGQVMDVPLGDPVIELGTAFEFLPGDAGISRLQDQQKIMRVKIRDVADVEERHQVPAGTIKGESYAGDLFQFEKQIANLGARNVSGYSVEDSDKNTGTPTKVAVKELFTRPCALYPQGRYQVVAGSTLLKDEEELPYDFGQDIANPFPVVEFCDQISPGQYWPTTMVEQLVGLQKEYNNVRNKVEEQLKLQAHPKLLVPKQANLAPNAYGSEAGEKIEYHFIPGMPPPGFLAPPNMAADTWRILQIIKEEFDEISNIRPADVGNVSNGGESGFQTNLLQEASESVHAPDIRRNELAIEEASFKIRRLLAQGYTIPRLLSIAGKNNAPDVFEFSQDQIDEHADVIVQAGSALPTLKAARSKMIMEMHQALLFGQPGDPAVNRRVLGMLEVGGIEEAEDVLRRDEEMSRMENLDVSKQRPIDAPMPWENHQIHYENHTDQLKSPDIKSWAAPQRDELVRHVILHARFINPQNALMLAQQFGYNDLIAVIQPMLPPPPGAPPGAPPGPGGPAGPPPPGGPPQGPPPGPSPDELASNEHIAHMNATAKVQAAHVAGQHQTARALALAQHQTQNPQLPQ